jgi:hypothetical protein
MCIIIKDLLSTAFLIIKSTLFLTVGEPRIVKSQNRLNFLFSWFKHRIHPVMYTVHRTALLRRYHAIPFESLSKKLRLT